MPYAGSRPSSRSFPLRQVGPPFANPLSPRETEVLNLLARGMSFAEISSVLNISCHTVTAHIKKIYRKLQVHSRGEAVYEAAQLGIHSGHVIQKPRLAPSAFFLDWVFYFFENPVAAFCRRAFSSRRISVMHMPRSTALSMS